MAALTQNGDGLRAVQAGAADDDDLHRLTSIVDGRSPVNRVECASDAQIEIDRAAPVQNHAFLFLTPALFLTSAAAIRDILVTGGLGYRARHG